MDRRDQWKLADELNAYQIVLLMAGYDPAVFEPEGREKWSQTMTHEIAPFLNAIQNGARTGKFKFAEERITWRDGDEVTDWRASLINIDSLVEWLRQRNFVDGFFIADQPAADRLTDADGPFYAPKLAAAVRAWNEVTTSLSDEDDIPF